MPSEEGWSLLAAAKLRLIPWTRLIPWAGLLLWGCQTEDTRVDPPQVRVGIRTSVSTETTRQDSLADGKDTSSPPKLEVAASTGVQLASAGETVSPVKKAAFESPRADALVASSADLPLQMTLDQAISTSLDRNPTLVALRATDPIARAALHVAETYPFNPYVQLEVLPYVRELPGFQGAVTNYVLLMQTLELAHQQRHREASAAASLEQVRWNIVSAELLNSSTTERLYFTALYQRELRDLAQRNAALNEKLLGVVERRFTAGIAKPAEQTTARVASRQSRKQADLAEANFQTAVLALRRQLNLSSDEPLELVGRLEGFYWQPLDGTEPKPGQESGSIQVPSSLAAAFASERPDVRAAQAGSCMAQSNADLARANRVQNIQVGPFYERDDYGTLFFGLRAQMNLPVFDTGRPLSEQREAEAEHQMITLEQLRSRATVEVQTAVERYERARRIATRERSDFSRTMPEQLQRVRDLFEAGQADILSVFATQTSLLQEYRAYLDLLNELAQAAADVTLAAGVPPARLISGTPPANRPPVPPLP